jgi:hypothetical protein
VNLLDTVASLSLDDDLQLTITRRNTILLQFEEQLKIIRHQAERNLGEGRLSSKKAQNRVRNVELMSISLSMQTTDTLYLVHK